MKFAFIQKNMWSDNQYFHMAREQTSISIPLSAFEKEFHKGNGDSYFRRGIWEVILSKESQNLTNNRHATGRCPFWLLRWLCILSHRPRTTTCGKKHTSALSSDSVQRSFLLLRDPVYCPSTTKLLLFKQMFTEAMKSFKIYCFTETELSNISFSPILWGWLTK